LVGTFLQELCVRSPIGTAVVVKQVYTLLLTFYLFTNYNYLITGEGPRPKLHNTRLLIKGKVGDINCTRTLQRKK
jgi:hypothetical protein